MKSPNQKFPPIWKLSMVDGFSLHQIKSFLEEISENGDAWGYEHGDESQYYLEYKELFDELADGAYEMLNTLRDLDLSNNWDDMVVALIGPTHKVLGFDVGREDYFSMLSRFDEDYALEYAEKKLERLTKRELIHCFQKVLTTLVLFLDIKARHDCLCAIVDELDERGTILTRMMDNLFQRTGDLNEKYETEYDKLIASMPNRAWVE